MFKNKKFTISEFAKMHGLNKRTLHYYDSIGLFSPSIKGFNNYRYYSFDQSIELDYILMLKKIGMSINEIKVFLEHPSSYNFLNMANEKIPELDEEIEKLKKIKKFLQYKKEVLLFCDTINESSIKILELDEEYFITSKLNNNDSFEIMYNTLKKKLNTKQTILGYGSYIDIKNLQEKNYVYDGLFAQTEDKEEVDTLLVKPKGTYICAYYKGSWDNLPQFYNEIFDFANKNKLCLEGYAYEISLNDFIISSKDEYITKINIKIK